MGRAFHRLAVGNATAKWQIPRAGKTMADFSMFSPAEGAAPFGSVGNVASFRMQVSRKTLKVRLGAPQCPFAPFGFNELDGFDFGHGFAAILAMSAR